MKRASSLRPMNASLLSTAAIVSMLAASAASAEDWTLNVGLGADFTTFNPYQAISVIDNNTIQLPYDRLISLDTTTGNVEPYLASSWEVTPTSVTFNIRDDATCADGTALTPSVIEASFKYMLDPETKNTMLYSLFYAGPYSVASDDAAGTVTFSVETPNIQMLQSFAHPSTAIVCPSGMEAPDGLKATPSGSGPYVLKSATHNDKLVFERRDEWNWGPPNVDPAELPKQIVMHIVPDATTMTNLVSAGSLDLAQISGSNVPRLQATPDITAKQAVIYTPVSVWYFGAENTATADPLVRQALSSTLSQEAFGQVMYSGRATPAKSYFGVGETCFQDMHERLPAQDFDKAAELLTQAGYAKNDQGIWSKDGNPLVVRLLGHKAQGDGPQYLQAQFLELGVQVDYQNVDFTTYATQYVGGDWDVTIRDAQQSGPSSFILYVGPRPPAGKNRLGYSDPVAEEAVKRGYSASDPSDCQGWADYQARVLETHAVFPLVEPQIFWFGRGVTCEAIGVMCDYLSLKRE